MFIKKLGYVVLVSGIVFGLSGCTARMNYKSSVVTTQTNKYHVQATINYVASTEGLGSKITNTLTLFINNKIVFKGDLTPEQSGNFQAMYDNKVLNIACARESMFEDGTTCTITLDDSVIANLRLRYEQD